MINYAKKSTFYTLIAFFGALFLTGCQKEKVMTIPEDSVQAKLNWAVLEDTDKNITLGSFQNTEEDGKKTYKEKLQLKKVCISGVVYLIIENYVYTSTGSDAVYSITPFLELNKDTKALQPVICERGA